MLTNKRMLGADWSAIGIEKPAAPKVKSRYMVRQPTEKFGHARRPIPDNRLGVDPLCALVTDKDHFVPHVGGRTLGQINAAMFDVHRADNGYRTASDECSTIR